MRLFHADNFRLVFYALQRLHGFFALLQGYGRVFFQRTQHGPACPRRLIQHRHGPFHSGQGAAGLLIAAQLYPLGFQRGLHIFGHTAALMNSRAVFSSTRQ